MTRAEKIYGDIINLPHPVSKTHEPMSRENRAAQFAPFAALVGFDETINETERLTEKQITLSEDEIEELNQKVEILKRDLEFHPQVKVTYFVPDKTKSGGAYETFTGSIKRFDDTLHAIVFADKKVINIEDIIQIEIINK